LQEIMEKIASGKGEGLAPLEKELKSTLQEYAGVIREGKELEVGVSKIERLKKAFSFPHQDPQKYWPAFTLLHEITVAEMILRSAVAREESRGAHFREDFPFPNDKDGLVNIILAKNKDGKMGLSSELVPSAS